MARTKKIRHTREQIVERTQREFERLDALVSGLNPESWHLPVPRPETRAAWTIKDALAHIVYWKAHSARVFRGARRPPSTRGLDVEQLNQLVYEQWRNRPPEEVLAWHREIHAEVIRTLAGLPAEWFGRREHGPEWPADFDGHSAAHRVKDIEAALSAAN
jgi:Mycothiol maleylpyruvate isomerase N-terminal domain